MESWFILRVFTQHLKLLGPIDLKTLHDYLRTGRVSFSDFAYQPKDRRKWVRIFEVADLLTALPQAPSANEFGTFESQISELLAASKAESPPKEEVSKKADGKTTYIDYGTDWYLQFEAKEFGPYNFNELTKILKSEKLKGEILVWQQKLSNWIKIKSFQDLLVALPSALEESGRPIVEKGSEVRVHRRQPLVASVSIRTKEKMATGICHDISKGGLQATQLDAEVYVGELYSLMVHPVSVSGMAPFTVQAKAAWVDKYSKRMGFHFINAVEVQTLTMNLERSAMIAQKGKR